jgi:TonB-linked SusC/RagA family outer membrane protein
VFVGVNFLHAQTVQITGTVTSAEDGMPIPGASVSVKGTSIGAATDLDGKYTLAVPQSATTLVFSFVGMTQQEVVIGGRTRIDVVLAPDATTLEEIVVIGYGTGRSIGTVVGSVTQISAEKIQSKPVANVWDAMQGRVAGLQVYTSSGEPTQISSIRLHGVGSLGASNTPLYVLDGIPIASGNMLSINPNDIESVSVLKDASATSIYGSRAANGVIYITTKRGHRDTKAKITVNSQYGVSSLANEDFFNGFMNSKQLTDFWLAVGFRTQAQVDALLAPGHDTKWHTYYYKDSAPTKQTDVSIQGGGGKTTYFVSGAYFFQDGLATRSEYERWSTRANINSQANDWLSFGSNIALSTDSRQLNGWNTNNTNRGLAMLAPPFYSPYDADGKPYKGLIPGWGRYDPYYLADMYPSVGNNIQANLQGYVQITPMKGLTIKSQAGVDSYDYRSYEYRMPSFIGSLNNGYVYEYFSRRNSMTMTNTAEYKFNIDARHQFTVLGGQEYVTTDYVNFDAISYGQTDDRLMLLNAGPTNRNVSQEKWEFAYLSYFGRFDYSLDQKYYLDLSIRQDASSRFGRDNRTAMFYATGVMWNAKKESFLQDVDLVSALNVKLSYGTSGNSDIGNYDHLATVGTSQYDGGTGWLISAPGNPKLSWEKQSKLTFGVKFALLNKYRFNIEYYNRSTSSQLIDVPQPYTSGFNTILENVGTIKNSGIDLEFEFDIVNTKDYYVTPYFNINYNKNEITELFQGLDYWIIPNTGVAWVVGSPVMFYRPIFAGVDPADGNPMWYLPGPDRKVTTKNETTKVFNAANLEQNTGDPRYAPIAGGFGLNAGWKGLAIVADFAFVKDKFLFNNDRYFFENPSTFPGFNQSETILDYWKQAGDETTFPRYGVQFTQFDSRLIEDASFIRMKNLTLSYTLPKSLLQKTKLIEGTRIYFTGRNLLTFTKYLGPDPEVDSNISLGANPNTKQFTFGISLTL